MILEIYFVGQIFSKTICDRHGHAKLTATAKIAVYVMYVTNEWKQVECYKEMERLML